MKIKRRMLTWGYLIVVGWFLAVAHAKGETINYTAQLKTEETKYKSPSDMLDMVPVLGKIPRAFSLGDGYSVKFSADQLRIDHLSRDSRVKPTPRTCTIGLSYSAPVGGSFSSRFDLPLFNAPTLAWSDWSRSSISDYAVCMSRTPVDHAALKIALSARF